MQATKCVWYNENTGWEIQLVVLETLRLVQATLLECPATSSNIDYENNPFISVNDLLRGNDGRKSLQTEWYRV